MNPADHFTATIGEDPFELAAQIESAAAESGRLRAEAAHLERIRKVKLSEVARAYRGAATSRVTVAEVEDAARTSDVYREHLVRQRDAEVAAAEAEARYYHLRNRQDWLFKAADAMRAEAYLSR